MQRDSGYWMRVGGAALVTGLAAMIGGLCARQARRFAHPTRFAVEGTPSDYGFTRWRDVTLMTSDGLTLRGWFLLPSLPRAKRPTILFVHGIAGNRLQFIETARWLAKHGYAALLFDLRNHGSSDGTVTTLGRREVEDVKAAFAYLSTQPEVDAENITLFGHSMGGSTAILAMAQLPQARALIVDTAYTSLDDVTSDGVRALVGTAFPVSPVIMRLTNLLTGENLYNVRPIDVMPTLAPRPVLILHGMEDVTIPVSHAEALYEAAQDPKTLWLVKGGAHGNLYQIAQTEYEAQVLRFLGGLAAG